MTSEITSVLIVEDIAETRERLSQIASQAVPGVSIALAPNLAQARRLLADKPDLVLIDLNLPDGYGLDLLREIRAKGTHPICVVTTVIGEDSVVVSALCAGADGYLLKENPAETILRQLREICRGNPALSPAITRRIMAHFASTGPLQPSNARLTPRETEALSLIARGMTNREVARAMQIAETTVAGYVKSVYEKLGIGSRAEAAWHASRMGL